MNTTTKGARLEESRSARFAIRCANWAERWFPDSWVFAVAGIFIVVVAVLAMGAPLNAITKSFGTGFWSLIPFTMQMAFVVIGGYVVASSRPAARLIERLAQVPRNGRSAVAWVALISMAASLLNWGLSLVFGGLLVKALARRTDIRMDYRAAGAAAYLGLGRYGRWAYRPRQRNCRPTLPVCRHRFWRLPASSHLLRPFFCGSRGSCYWR